MAFSLEAIDDENPIAIGEGKRRPRIIGDNPKEIFGDVLEEQHGF